MLRTRIAMPLTISPNYDALVATGTDDALVGIAGETGDGILVIDLSSLPEPLPLPFASISTRRLLPMRQGSMLEGKRRLDVKSRKALAEKFPGRHTGMPDIINNLAIQRHVHQHVCGGRSPFEGNYGGGHCPERRCCFIQAHRSSSGFSSGA